MDIKITNEQLAQLKLQDKTVGRVDPPEPVHGKAISLSELVDELFVARARVTELEQTINSPHNADWFEGVRIEAAHQMERWILYDEKKEDTDWYWTLGYLAGKCLAAMAKGDIEKAKHHTISTGALLLNWYRTFEKPQ